MFIPNNTATLWRAGKRFNVRGERTFEAPIKVECAVVSLGLMVERTSVRADSSGSRGRAEEEQGNAVVLFPAYLTVEEKDVIEVDGEVLQVEGLFPRRSVLGPLDHIEAHLTKAERPQ